jgi:hypothetical protein
MERFHKLWAGSKKKLFRLQTFNQYIVDGEKEFVKKAAAGKWGEIYKSPESIEWFSMLESKRRQKVRNINVQVIDLPLSNYLKYEVGYMLKSEEFGRESFFVERKDAAELIEGVPDYWMFDAKKVLRPKYDKRGKYLGKYIEVTNPKSIKRHAELERHLLKKALPLRKFLKKHKITVKY